MARLFTPKERRTYQNLCHLTERGVISMMTDFLRSKYQSVISTPQYIIALGDIPVALVAHADTVFKTPPKLENFFYDKEKNVIWNPDGMGADDRAGVFAIMTILRTTNLRPHIIISTGEECGCIGSGKIIAQYRMFPGELNFMIQLDRRNTMDSVYYDCDNPDFEDYINAFGFKTDWGSFTDISILAPVWKVAAVNLSIGYMNEHQDIEHLYVDAMFNTIDKTIKILEDQIVNPKYFRYIEATYSSWYGYSYDITEDYGSHCRKAYVTAWDEDDWDLPTGYERCTFCQTVDQEVNMIPIHFKYGKTAYHTCLDCFGKHSDHILFCQKCGKGYYLGLTDLAKEDPYNFICEDCKNGIHSEGEISTPTESGASAQVESTLPVPAQQSGIVIDLGKAKSIFHKEDGRSVYVGIPNTSNSRTGRGKQKGQGRRVH